jgi:spore coat polysaccharide biosynthesis protein SpsF (cytidylyltransferase family)
MARAAPGAVLLARLDSTRLPGKVLAPVGAASLLELVVRRLPHDALASPLVLATTDRAGDDRLAQEGERLGLAVYRGSAADVAGRLIGAAQQHGFEAVLRVNADSPLLDPGLIRAGIERFRETDCALVTNLRPRFAPYGVSVEIFSIAALESALAISTSHSDREHVTSALYSYVPAASWGRLGPEDAPNLPPSQAEADLTSLCLTVDEPEDLAAFRQFAEPRLAHWEQVTIADAVASGVFRRRIEAL